MKKVFKIFAAIFALLLLLVLLLPVLFKGKIAEMVQQQMDENINASITVGDIDLSLISTFPDFGLEINAIKVVGKAPFEGIVLADIGAIKVKLDIMSVIKGDEMQIKKVGIQDASFHVIVNRDSLANYDIVKTDASAEAEQDTSAEEAPSAFKIALQEYYLRNISLIYDDVPGDMYVELKNLNHEGNGDFTQDIFLLTTQTNIEALTFRMEGMRYLKKARFDIKFDTEIDMPNSKYTFKENHFGINNLMLHFDGFVALPDSETTEMDITFNTERTDFKSVLSLVPAVYLKDFESVQTSGNFSLGGFAKGAMKGDRLPAFSLALKVDNGMFKYPDLPKSVNNILIDLKADNPGGSDDNTVVDLRKFHMELGTNPIDIRYLVKTPVSDPDMEGIIKAAIDLATLNDILPTEAGEQYAGKIMADINLKGRLSTIEQEDYENFDASGSMVLEGIAYSDSSLGYPVVLHKADFRFTPRQIDMAELRCNLGRSDISGSGFIGQYLPYYFREETLVARMDVQSVLLDLNELAGTDADTSSAEEVAEGTVDSTAASGESEVVEIPGNVDFELNSKFEKVLYDNIEMTEMIGKITLRNSKVSMDNLSMKMLGGGLKMNGFYETTNPAKPTVDFALDIEKFDVKQTFTTFNTVQKMAPIAENAQGAFSTGMKLVCVLDTKMEPITNTITGGGVLKTHDVKVEGSETLNKMADALKNDDLRTLTLKNVDISYSFKDGRVWVAPFDLEMGGAKANISGSNGFDQTLDYLAKMEVPTSTLGAGAGAVQGLLSQFNQATGANAAMGDKINVDVRITGTATNPKIAPSFPKLGGSGSAGDDLKKQARQEIDRLKKEAEEKARAEADRIRKETEEKARAEADRLKKEAEEKARAEADRIKKEAEAKARKEAEAAKKKAEEELKKKGENELKKLFGK
jgi:hypothetical protein